MRSSAKVKVVVRVMFVEVFMREAGSNRLISEKRTDFRIWGKRSYQLRLVSISH